MVWRETCSLDVENPRSITSLMEGGEFLEGNRIRSEGRREKWEGNEIGVGYGMG